MIKTVSVSLGVIVLIGCNSLTLPDRDPILEGEIVEIGAAAPFGSARTVWVKTDESDPCGIVFGVTEETVIAARDPDGSLVDRSFDDLVAGQRVRVWARFVAESCPGQSSPDAIEILP